MRTWSLSCSGYRRISGRLSLRASSRILVVSRRRGTGYRPSWLKGLPRVLHARACGYVYHEDMVSWSVSRRDTVRRHAHPVKPPTRHAQMVQPMASRHASLSPTTRVPRTEQAFARVTAPSPVARPPAGQAGRQPTAIGRVPADDPVGSRRTGRVRPARACRPGSGTAGAAVRAGCWRRG